MMQTTRIPSPARSQDAITPRRSKPRTTRSVSSSAVSGTSGRPTSIIDEFKEANRNSFAPSPLNKSVLTDNTEIEHPRRQSWWKKVNQSRNIDEVIGIETAMEPNNIMDDLEIEVLSQNKHNYSLDLPESSGSESIASIVLPQRKLLTQKENVPHDIFKQILNSRQSMTQQNKTNVEDKTVNISAKTLFGQGVKRSRPAFPAALLSRTPVKTQADKTRELPIEVKAQRHNLFGHRPDTERKNIFADFIVSESEDEMSDIQPKLFAFQRNTNPVRHSTASRASRGDLPIYRETSPASSITTDIEMEEWKMLPSSTMMEHQFEAGAASTPGKRARISKFTKPTPSKSNESKVNENKDVEETISKKQILQLNKSKEINNTSLKTFIESEKSTKVTKMLNEPNTADIVQENENDDDENLTLTYDDNEQPDNGESHATINRVNKLEQQTEELFKERDDNFPVNVSINKDNNENINQSKLKNICLGEEMERTYEKHLKQNDGKENYDNRTLQDEDLDITLVQNYHEKRNADQQKLKEKDIDTADKEISITNEEIEVDKEVGGFVETADSENKADQEVIQLEDDEEAQVQDEGEQQNVSEEENEKDQNEDVYMDVEEENEIENEEDDNEDKDHNKTKVAIESEEGEQNESEEENEEDQNKSEIAVESEEEQRNESEVENEDDQNEDVYMDVEQENEIENEEDENEDKYQNKTEVAIESEEQQNESEEENEDQNKTEIAVESEEEQFNESEVENEEDQNEDEDVDIDVEPENEIEDLIEENEEYLGGEVQESEQQEIEDSETSEAEAINSDVTHNTTGKSHQKDVKSLEAVLDNISNQNVSFIHKGRNTSIRKTVLKNLTIRQSEAPLRESTGLDDGTKNSSAGGSCWDSHRTTRKTLRQTFGKDFTPRKSLRTLVMEKSAKRQTAINEANAKMHQANSTEIPGHNTPDIDVEFDNAETIDVSNHEISKRMRQTKLEAYLQNVKKAIESKLKIETEVRNLLKRKPVKVDSLIHSPYKSIRKTNIKSTAPKAKKRTKPNVVALEDMPEEFIEDMKYRPPKRYQPRNAPWITKRLYKFLETKLEAKYDYKARLRAEKLVETLYEFTRRAHKQRVASPHAIAELEHEMARLDIVKTHLDFYDFFHDYMPREVIIKVVPDIVNDIPLPRNGPFSNIIE